MLEIFFLWFTENNGILQQYVLFLEEMAKVSWSQILIWNNLSVITFIFWSK